MHPSSLHHVDPDRRAKRLSSISVDPGNHISDAYEALADEETTRMLSALRHGVVLAGIETTLSASEWMTTVSPESGVPFRSKVWTALKMEDGTAEIAGNNPYRIVSARTADGPAVKSGQEVTMQQALFGASRGMSASYDPDTGKITGTGVDSDYTGMIWVPEQRLESPAVQLYMSQSHSLSLSDLGPSYPPPHLFHLTRLLETARQMGARNGYPFKVAQAVYGAPFAYAEGTILGYETDITDGLVKAVIEAPGGEKTASFLPKDADPSLSALKSAGTDVDRFEPLVSGGSSSIQGGVDRQLEDPIVVESTDRASDTITLEDNSHGLSSGDRAMLRVLTQGYESFVVVESTSGDQVTIRGEVGRVGSSDWAYLFPRDLAADGGGSASITVESPYAPTELETVRGAVSRGVPPNVSYSVSDSA